MKYIGSDCLKSIKDESGNVLILVAGAMVVLLGMAVLAVDVGLLYLVRREMVNAADAAALAGVQQLVVNDSGVIPEVINYAETNDADAFSYSLNGEYELTVKTTKAVDLLFAPAFYAFSDTTSINGQTVVGAWATAEALPINIMEGLSPYAITLDAYENNVNFDQPQTFTLQRAVNGESWIPVDLDSDQPVAIGDVLVELTGAPNDHSINGELDYIPIIIDDNGGYRIVGFAAVEGLVLDGVGDELSGTFVRAIAVDLDPDPDPNADSFGLYGVRLIE